MVTHCLPSLLYARIPSIMGGDVAVLPSDVEALKRLVVQLQQENSTLRSKAEVLEDELEAAEAQAVRPAQRAAAGRRAAAGQSLR